MKKILLAMTTLFVLTFISTTQSQATTIGGQEGTLLPSPQIFRYHDNIVQFPRDVQLVSYEIEESCVSDNQDPKGDLAPGKYAPIQGSNKDQIMLHCGRHDSTKVADYLFSTIGFSSVATAEAGMDGFLSEANFATMGTLVAKYNEKIYRFEHVLLAQYGDDGSNYWMIGQRGGQDLGWFRSGGEDIKSVGLMGYSDDHRQIFIPLRGANNNIFTFAYTFTDDFTNSSGTREYSLEEAESTRPKRVTVIFFDYVDEEGKEIHSGDCHVTFEGDYYDPTTREIKAIDGYKCLGLFDANGNKVNGDIHCLANQDLKYYYRYAKLETVNLDFYYVDDQGAELHESNFAALTEGDSFDPKDMKLELRGYECLGLFDEEGNQITGDIQVVENQHKDLKYYYHYAKKKSVDIELHYIDEQGKELRSSFLHPYELLKSYEGDSFDPQTKIEEIQGYKYIGCFDESGNPVPLEPQPIRATSKGHNLKYYYSYVKKQRHNSTLLSMIV